jgi:predicted nucleotidyltransferase
MREQLLSYLPWFVSAAARIPGVRRVKLLGSITTDKQNPKDIDFLIEIEDAADLGPLAKLGRKMQGRAQQMGRGADIFLANPAGQYIGRTCHWKDCGPGIRTSCDALNRGKRHYLHDDLESINLSAATVQGAFELWPSSAHVPELPEDVKKIVSQLEI